MSVNADDRAQQLAVAMGQYADGDFRAFEDVYHGLAPLVVHCIRRWQRDVNRIDDLLQETFSRVHQARHRYRRGAPVAPWVLTIARRLCIDVGRRDKRHREDLAKTDRTMEPSIDGRDDPDNIEALLAALRTAVNELPDNLRQVVQMHKLDGYPLAIVARELGIKEGTARVRAHRGYAKLKDQFRRAFGRQES
jgi:RNA polymerase sigma-70 factor (ECF subfamily)